QTAEMYTFPYTTLFRSRVGGFQGPGLPGSDLVDHLVGDRRDQIRRDLDAVELAHVPLNIPGAHAAGVKGDDLVVEAGETPAVLGDRKSTRLNSSHVKIS